MKKLIPATSGGPDAAEGEGTSRRAVPAGHGGRRGRRGRDPRHAQGRRRSRLDSARAPALPSPRPSSPSPPAPRRAEPVTAYVRDAAARRGDRAVRQAGDDLQRPGAREAAARRSPLTRSLDQERRNQHMSSHREAPEISKDPVVDNTDTYAFVSPDNPETVTIITNYLPAEVPAGGPTFFEFGNDVLYTIHIDNNGDGYADIVYEFTFEPKFANPNTFLYNTGPISSLVDPNWNKRQFYTRRARRTATATHGARRRAWHARRATSARARRRNTRRSKKKRSTRCRAARRCSPASATTRSSSTSGRSSTSADLRPIQNLHLIPDAGDAGRGHAGDAQLPHDRDPGPDQQPDRSTARCRRT